MDTYPPSTISVTVTVASELEPVACDGTLCLGGDGFTVSFILQRDKFTIEHSADVTKIVTDGDMSYAIELCSRQTETLLNTPYGAVRFAVKTLERTVERIGDKIKIVLRYILSSDGAGELERSVNLVVDMTGETRQS